MTVTRRQFAAAMAAQAPLGCDPRDLDSFGRPTSAPAGSDAKIAWLRARAARGEPLWHPDDETRITDEPSQLRRV